MQIFSILLNVSSIHICKVGLKADEAASEQVFVCSKSSARLINQFSHGFKGLQFHANQVQSSTAEILLSHTTQLFFHGFPQGISILVSILLVDELQVLWRRGAQYFENSFFICSNSSLTKSMDSFGIISCLFWCVELGVVSFFRSLQAIKDQSFHVPMQFSCQHSAEVFVVHLKEGLFQHLHLFIGSTGHDAPNDVHISSHTFHGFLEHETFGLIGRKSQVFQCGSKVSREFFCHQISHVLEAFVI
mmetsp:Transcript_14277/g.39669  ORF Transcript_14277/g.39669 Transcript_14277/m.39669 type:complete len:246 (-) Transcript_14277:317-1054(-)